MAGVVSQDITSMPDRPALSATSDTPAVPQETPVAPPAAPEPEAPAVETPAAEGAAGEAGEEGAPAAPSVAEPRRPIAPRLAELSAARRAADARADKLAAMVEKLLEERTRPETAAPEAAPKPSRDQFADPDSFEEALVGWASNQAATLAAQKATEALEQRLASERDARSRTEQEEAGAREAADLQSKWQERRAKAIEVHPDFSEVAETDDFMIPNPMVPALLVAENGPEVLYYLATNREEVSRIGALNPLQQAIEIGKISATLTAPPRPRTTRAPPPIEPVGARNAAGPKHPDDMTTEEYAAARMPKLQSERKARMFGQRPN